MLLRNEMRFLDCYRVNSQELTKVFLVELMSQNLHSFRNTNMCDGLRRDNMDRSIYTYLYMYIYIYLNINMYVCMFYDLKVVKRLID